MLRKTTVIFALVHFLFSVQSQQLRFTPFEGTSYHIPYENYKLGYGAHVTSYDTLSTFTWDQINVSERNTDVAFPDVPKTSGFGIVKDKVRLFLQFSSPPCASKTL